MLFFFTDPLAEITATGSPELNITCDCAIPSCTEPEYMMIRVITTKL